LAPSVGDGVAFEHDTSAQGLPNAVTSSKAMDGTELTAIGEPNTLTLCDTKKHGR
jgi:hypothetical protein